MPWNSSLPDRRAPMKRSGFARKPSSPMKRSGFLRTKRPKGVYPSTLRQTPLRKVSKKQAGQMRKYYDVRAEYLRTHIVCAVCLMVFPEHKPAPATEVHHIFGRAGSLLCDPRGFCGTCREHRDFPHEHPALARELGLLGMPAQWNVAIDRHPK